MCPEAAASRSDVILIGLVEMGVSEDRTDRALLLTVVTCYAQAPVNGFENNSLVLPEEPAPVTALPGQHSPVPEPYSLVGCSSVAC